MRIILINFLFLFSMACSVSPQQSAAVSPSLLGVRWALVQVDGADVSARSRDAHLVLGPDSTRTLSGSTGCNLLHGTYQMDNNELRFSDMVITRRACLGPNVENEWLSVLMRATHFRCAGDTLALLENHQEIALLKKTPDTP